MVSEVQEPGELDTAKPRKARNPPFTKLSFKNDARTNHLLWAWSGDHLFNLSRNEALRIIAREVNGKPYLFVERGDFNKKRPTDWKPTLLVLGRPDS